MLTPMSLGEVLAKVMENDLEAEKTRQVESDRAQKALVAQRRAHGGMVGIEALVDKAQVEQVDQKPLEVPKKEIPVNGRFPLPPGAKR